jgi:hypothetical protein
VLSSVQEIKERAEGESVSFRARALRLWEIGEVRMCLAGDESALTRVEVGDANVKEGSSYEFRDAVVKQYPGGWTSASIVDGGEAVVVPDDVPVSQDEAYIERTFKILSGIQRKKARKEGRLPPWQHPSERGE